MKELLNEIEQVELMLLIYSDRDRTRTIQLLDKLDKLNAEYLELMVA